jgi:hypothetical protein
MPCHRTATRLRWAIAPALAVALLLAHLGSADAQIPRLGGVAKKIKEKAAAKASAETVFRPRQPVTTSIDDAVTEIPFLDLVDASVEFAPMTSLPRSAEGGFVLRPGAFEMRAQSYCLRAGTYGPSRGDGYVYAPLAGPDAPAIASILRNSVRHPDIPQAQIQTLIWAIIARARIEDLSREHQAIATRLLSPAEMLTLNRHPRELLTAAAREATMANLPPLARQILEAEQQLREMLTAGAASYDQLERVAVRAGLAPEGPGSRQVPSGRWSYHPDGYFVRYMPTGYQVTHVQIYVPGRDSVARDALGRVTVMVDAEGNRIETEYDDTVAPLAIGGDGGIRGYAFKTIRFIGPDPSNAGRLRREEIRDDGWTFVGAPNGVATEPSAPGAHRRFDGWRERYVEARRDRDAIRETLTRLRKTARDRRAECGDLGDMRHFEKGLRAALADKPRDKAPWIGRHMAKVGNAWKCSICDLVGGCDPEKPFDPSGNVAVPGNTSKQRLGQSARPAS